MAIGQSPRSGHIISSMLNFEFFPKLEPKLHYFLVFSLKGPKKMDAINYTSKERSQNGHYTASCSLYYISVEKTLPIIPAAAPLLR